jgi:hypothetical protein
MVVVQHAAETPTSQNAAAHGCVLDRGSDELLLNAARIRV